VGQSGQHETTGKRFVNDLFYGIRTGHVQITFLSLLMGHARLLLLRPVFFLQIISGGIVNPPAEIICFQYLKRVTQTAGHLLGVLSEYHFDKCTQMSFHLTLF